MSVDPSVLSPREKRSSISLAAIFALRMLGLFLILPVFAVYAKSLPGGDDTFAVGLALGIYGLTQGVLQIPFGVASDRFGRKPVIAVGLIIFAVGSVVAAVADSVFLVMIGRAIQGAGAVSAAVTAMIADSVRPRVLTRAMAFVGASIGLTFAFSLIASPVIASYIGVPGLFWLTAVLATTAVAVVYFVVPDVPAGELEPTHATTDAVTRTPWQHVVFNPQLLRLNLGIFALHMAQMAMFVVIPVRLVELNLDLAHHWTIYLPAVLASFVIFVPAIIQADKRDKVRILFIASIALILADFVYLNLFDGSILAIAFALFVFFSGFNILEATLPSLVSKTAPATEKGLALGVYNTTQSIGLFAGGALGGAIASNWGGHTVYLFCAALMLVWLLCTHGMKTPAPATKGLNQLH